MTSGILLFMWFEEGREFLYWGPATALALTGFGHRRRLLEMTVGAKFPFRSPSLPFSPLCPLSSLSMPSLLHLLALSPPLPVPPLLLLSLSLPCPHPLLSFPLPLPVSLPLLLNPARGSGANGTYLVRICASRNASRNTLAGIWFYVSRLPLILPSKLTFKSWSRTEAPTVVKYLRYLYLKYLNTKMHANKFVNMYFKTQILRSVLQIF